MSNCKRIMGQYVCYNSFMETTVQYITYRISLCEGCLVLCRKATALFNATGFICGICLRAHACTTSLNAAEFICGMCVSEQAVVIFVNTIN
jgi:hypothetical protein